MPNVFLIAEKLTRVFQLNTMGFPINSIPVSEIIQKLNNLIKIVSYCSFSEKNSKVFISGVNSIITLINKADKEVSEHYSSIVEACYKKKLKELSVTPIHFKTENIFQQLIELNSENWQNKKEKQKLETYEIINPSVKIASKLKSNKSTIKPEVEAFNIYVLSVLASIYEADVHVFGDLSLDDIVSTEYVYSYKDERGRIQTDTTTIYAYMLRHIKEFNSLLSARDHIKIKFPKEFQSGLIYYLEEEFDNIKEHYFSIEKFRGFIKNRIISMN